MDQIEEDDSEELMMKLSTHRQGSSNKNLKVEDVVFGNISVTVKDAKSFRTNNLTLSLRVVYPKVYEAAVPIQETNKPIGHCFRLNNITTEVRESRCWRECVRGSEGVLGDFGYLFAFLLTAPLGNTGAGVLQRAGNTASIVQDQQGPEQAGGSGADPRGQSEGG